LAESNQLDRDFDPAPTSRSTATQSNAAGPTLLVHNRKLALKYDVEDAGPNGPAFVQLWTTRDGGRTWTPQPEDADKRSPYNVDLGSDGTFGLWLVVQSASGLGDSPPASMDRPQSWVEVDATPPAVSVGQPKIGKGQHAGKVLITWKATDGHIAPQPISLFYREDKPEAPWVPIEEGRENNGRYVWSPQGSIPPRFHIKVEAVDTFGNRGSSDSQDYGAILLDRAKPKGRIIGLEQNDATTRQ
jgi:hypothetical protein